MVITGEEVKSNRKGDLLDQKKRKRLELNRKAAKESRERKKRRYVSVFEQHTLSHDLKGVAPERGINSPVTTVLIYHQ